MPVEPNPFDDARLAQIRESQEDPIVQYYIVRKDVGMSAGKACAQVAHAAQMFIMGYYHMRSGACAPHTQHAELLDYTVKWIGGSFRKVVLSGTDKDFEKIKSAINVFVVRDAGLTEVEPGTETVLVLWPMPKSKVPKIISRLQVLKELKPKEQ